MTHETVEDLVNQLAKWEVTTVREGRNIRIIGQGDRSFPRRPLLDATDDLLQAWLAQARRDDPTEEDPLDLLAIGMIGSVTAEITEGGNTATRVGLCRGTDGRVTTYDDRDHARERTEYTRGLPSSGLEWRTD